VKFSIVILAGGQAKRLGVDKALIVLKGKPLIGRTVENIWAKSEDILIVTKSEKRAKNIKQVLRDPVKVIWDEEPALETPLIGALSGFKEAKYENVLLLGCDMPLIKPEVIDLLFDSYAEVAATGEALIPQHPNGYLEPLCAIYKREPAINALLRCLEENSYKLKSFIDHLSAVYFYPITEIQKRDPELSTFFNVNTRDDLVKLLRILEESERE
jgi:molybdopterin-guanine dinucleotide biosynthesis protein A